ncbi:MAG: hypothetical protein ACFCBW_07745 [Candidatus Competibacterales bacterium]
MDGVSALSQLSIAEGLNTQLETQQPSQIDINRFNQAIENNIVQQEPTQAIGISQDVNNDIDVPALLPPLTAQQPESASLSQKILDHISKLDTGYQDMISLGTEPPIADFKESVNKISEDYSDKIAANNSILGNSQGVLGPTQGVFSADSTGATLGASGSPAATGGQANSASQTPQATGGSAQDTQQARNQATNESFDGLQRSMDASLEAQRALLDEQMKKQLETTQINARMMFWSSEMTMFSSVAKVSVSSIKTLLQAQ